MMCSFLERISLLETRPPGQWIMVFRRRTRPKLLFNDLSRAESARRSSAFAKAAGNLVWSGRAPLSLQLLERDPRVHGLLACVGDLLGLQSARPGHEWNRPAGMRQPQSSGNRRSLRPVFLTGSSFAVAVPKKRAALLAYKFTRICLVPFDRPEGSSEASSVYGRPTPAWRSEALARSAGRDSCGEN
jgi:hypothetical protein